MNKGDEKSRQERREKIIALEAKIMPPQFWIIPTFVLKISIDAHF